MRIPKKSHELIRQNEQIVKKSQKHDANLQKNSVLYFQIGLIVCLMTAYGLLEMRFESNKLSDESAFVIDLVDNVEYSPKNYKVYVEPAAEIKPQEKKKVVLTLPPKVVDDEKKMLEDINIITPDQNTTSETPVDPNFSNLTEEPEEVFVSFERVETVPVYPGCENKKSNSARKKCMSDKLTKLIQRKFNTNIAGDLGLSGIQKIQTQFTIDKNGNIIDVKTRSPYPQLEKEAKRVINTIPDMEPGKQRNEPVGVKYTMPIKFQVQD